MECQNKEVVGEAKMATRRRARDKEIPEENPSLSERISPRTADAVDVSQITLSIILNSSFTKKKAQRN